MASETCTSRGLSRSLILSFVSSGSSLVPSCKRASRGAVCTTSSGERQSVALSRSLETELALCLSRCGTGLPVSVARPVWLPCLALLPLALK